MSLAPEGTRLELLHWFANGTARATRCRSTGQHRDGMVRGMRCRPVFPCAVVVAVALAGCGSSSDSGGTNTASTTGQAASKPACQPARKTLTASLESSLTASGGGKLRKVRVVKVTDAPSAPLAGFKAGVYVASGQLVAPGIEGETLSWAISNSMRTTGGGLALALDEVMREFSDLGAAAGPDSPARAYTDAVKGTDAYEQSRSCSEA
jgi:hypothetical protein